MITGFISWNGSENFPYGDGRYLWIDADYEGGWVHFYGFRRPGEKTGVSLTVASHVIEYIQPEPTID
jgi:hypothetical protein